MPSPLHCLVVDDDSTAQTLLSRYVNRHAALQLVDVCDGAVEAANVLSSRRVDLLLLDVEMPEMSGLELLETLDDPPAVVLITGSEEYAVDAFDLSVTDYLVKPVRYARFLKAVDRVQSRLSSASPSSNGVGPPPGDTAPGTAPSDEAEGMLTRAHMPDHAFLNVGDRLVRVAFDDIQFVEAKGDYKLVSTASDQHMIYSTMKELEERLPSDAFMRVHRSYLVRLDQIEEIEGDILIIGGHELPIGPSYRQDLIDTIQTL
ncbi:MAG: LytR/AlgR family response regulator transcription factor [Salinivenus sp.]